MCGILGVHGTHLSTDREIYTSALDRFSYRGPDGQAVWVDPKRRAILGHQRLALVDLVGGQQPLHSMDGTVSCVVNGELYDYKRIRDEYTARGYRFHTQSDSEILLPLYERYGIEMMKELRGEFAFILYDAQKDLLIAGRDRFGIKPLYYHIDTDGTLRLASEAKALFALGVRPEWDTASVSQACFLQYLPQERSLFRGVQQIKPGHLLIRQGANLREHRYWDISFPKESESAPRITEQEAADQLEALLKESVLLRLQSDSLPYACSLSGGIDSAMIAAMAARHGSRKPHCFSVAFPHPLYDESSIARDIASHLNVAWTPIPVRADDVVRVFSDAVYASEGLAINSHLSAKYLLSRAIREAGYPYVLTGEGSDEAFAGYAHLRRDADINRFEMRVQADQIVGGVQVAHGNTLPLDILKRGFGFVPSFLEAKASIGAKMLDLLVSDSPLISSPDEAMRSFVSSVPIDDQLRGRNPVYVSSYLWTKFALGTYILRTLGDGTEMAWSVEGRVPYLDHHLFEFAVALPLSYKVSAGIEKRILRRVAANYLPTEVVNRPKQSFMAPPLSLLADQCGMEYLRQMVSTQSFRDMHLFDIKAVEQLVQRLPTMSVEEQVAYEPVVMLMLSLTCIQSRFLSP